jgi:hypothetical protein
VLEMLAKYDIVGGHQQLAAASAQSAHRV